MWSEEAGKGGGYQKGLTYPPFAPYLISGHCKILLNTVNGVNTAQESHHKSVNYDRPGECSPEKDCL